MFPAIFVLLGGLQWYLIVTLLARWTCGFQKAMPVTSKRFGAVLFSGLLLVGGSAMLPWSGRLHEAIYPRNQHPYPLPPVAFSGDSKRLENSAIVPTLDTPMPDGKNVIWCATFQMAWSRLRDDVIGEPIRVANAEDVAERLNKAVVADDDLPAGSYYAAAGFTKDGVVERVRREMQEQFQKEPTDLDDKEAVILAYAYLRASVPFTLPYFDNDGAFQFTNARGQKTQVSSFGLRQKDESRYLDLRDQVDVLYLHRDKERDQPTEFALDLCRDSKPNQIILACIPRKGTALATLGDLDGKIAEGQVRERDRRLGDNAKLLVPNLHWSLIHHFAQLEGSDKRLLNNGFAPLYLGTAVQTIDFRLDRSGVELKSEAQIAAKSCEAPDFVFDRPFLIVVKKRGAERPFFVMWVDNAELLCKP